MATRRAPAQDYLRQLDSMLTRMQSAPSFKAKLECKRFFGGAAAYADNRIFMTLTAVGLALKLPEELREALLREGGKPLRYFARGHIKKEYVILPNAISKRSFELASWVARSIAYVTR